MSFFGRHKLYVITTAYWFLLLYIVAALFWWFIALNHQNKLLTELRLQELNKDNPQYVMKQQKISELQDRKTAQYIGEGSIFFVMILFGAVYVYRSTRRQLRLSRQEQNFMMAVTHELKTPIAVTRLNLETLQKRKLTLEQQQKLINNTLYEADRLNTLCNNILFAAQLEGGAYKTDQQKIDFSSMVKGCIESFQVHFPQRNINTMVIDGIYLYGEEVLLQMLVNNLVDNALKYSPKTTEVSVQLYTTNSRIEFQVADQGVGISEEEKKNIFKKFYRAFDENTRSTKGTGLGLYLCKKIVESHNGAISVIDNRPTGSIFTATFHK